MLANAMFLNPGSPNYFLIVLAIAAIGITIGLLWIRRITRLGDDVDHSSFRSRRRRRRH
jgi:hypothetical protein